MGAWSHRGLSGLQQYSRSPVRTSCRPSAVLAKKLSPLLRAMYMEYGCVVRQCAHQFREPGPIVSVDRPYYRGQLPTVPQRKFRTVVGQLRPLPPSAVPLSFTRPPIVNGQWEIHEHDRIRHSQTTLDSAVTSESIDNPGFRSCQLIQPAIAFVRWSSYPSRLVLDAVYVINRDSTCVTEQARKSGLAPACVSDHGYSLHRSRRRDG